MPLSLLVTKPTAQPVKGGATPFSGYKTVPWLTRDIVVAQIPSDKVITLKLDADWVVLSACNTAQLPVKARDRRRYCDWAEPSSSPALRLCWYQIGLLILWHPKP
ncbi:hypothetical protein [Polynucleobacter necessarius]|uniref:hypothetical protein n=1 Tax=Polynucleobacter necessarius TaxID=576610 RepID=UPI001E57C370|nr:hypothetical protein [Polynucleobacter necessarius]